MKTHREIIAEADRLERQGRRFADEHRLRLPALGGPSEMSPRCLMTLPETGFSPGGEDFSTHRCRRWIGLVLDDGEPDYLLIQEDCDEAYSGPRTRRSDLSVIMRSDSAYDVLREGYELAEEERLGEVLAPFMDQIEKAASLWSVDGPLVEEIERIAEADEFSVATRMRARADIVEFLEGRLEPSAFITAAIARQCDRGGELLDLSERPTVSMRQYEGITIEG